MNKILSFAMFENLDAGQKEVIQEVITALQNMTDFPVAEDDLKNLSNKLKSIGIKPVDIDAAIYDIKKQKQYLIEGPSAPGGGGQGALKDLQKMLNN